MTAIELKIIALVLAAGCLVGYHFVAMHDAVSQARAEDKAQFTAQVEQINAEAKADHEAMQVQLDAKAATDNAALQAGMAAIQARINSIGKIYAPTKALPVDCVLDPERLRLAAQALAE